MGTLVFVENDGAFLGGALNFAVVENFIGKSSFELFLGAL